VHDVHDDTRPWTHDNFDADDDKFTFAVFSDLSGGERDKIFEIAVAQLNLLRPELIMNVGDLIEGDSKDEAGLALEWDSFDQRARKAKAPIFYAGGNHDLTGEMLRQVWEERYGPRYYHFVYKSVLFLVLDTEDNTPERMQEIFDLRNQVLADNSDVRWTFLFMHKPAWKKEGEETFRAIGTMLVDRPYTVFYGHEQVYGYEQRHGRDYIRLATTGGEQYPEYGRSMDQVTLVTVGDSDVDIANLVMAGILDKTGHVPLGGEDVCFEKAVCGP
jgi:hypothetical protein